jgi:hypothetical protein
METLIIRKEVDGTPIRYHVKVEKEVVEKYAKVRKEHPELSELEALKKAQAK